MSLPSRWMPPVRSWSRESVRRSVDFPQPLGPTIAVVDAAGMSRLRSWRMVRPPRLTRTSVRWKAELIGRSPFPGGRGAR
ncbi:Uncharacterised protein [Mycobacteroides abscessus subsp. abscessus]|nr:Uncharacterised protein [Mycobacteroides abscessus subsp. abscessus]